MSPSLNHALRRKRAGLTLVEVVISAAMFSVMIAGLGMVDSACRKVARAQRETALASQTLDELVERLRTSNWSSLTRASTTADLLAQFQSDSIVSLARPTLRITVGPYPPVTPSATPLVVERASDGTTKVVSEPEAGFSLRSFLAVRVDARITWRATDGARERVREIASVVSLAGLLK